MRIEAKDSVAIVVDYQEKLLPVMDKKEQLIEHTEILLAGFRELGIPMVITQQYTKGLGDTPQELKDVMGISDYKEKIKFSAFDVIEEEIRDKKFVILCGIEAHICVLQTLIDLKANGYVPVLVEDCISSRTEHNKQIAVERAKQEGAILTTYESLLFELLKEAGTQTSKKIQRLIK